MTALSADLNAAGAIHPLLSKRHSILTNSAVLYRDAAFAIATATGLGKRWTGVSGEFLAGRWNTGKTTGDATDSPLTTGSPSIDDEVIEDVAVAGLASSSFQQDVLKYVYLGTDNIGTDLTLTRPAAPNNNPFGLVMNGKTATKCDVLRFGFRTQMILGMLGGVIEDKIIGVVGASGTALQGAWIAPYHGVFVSCYGLCVRAPTDVDVDIDAQLKIGSTAVTGGLIELIHGDAAGDKKAGTAITAANEFHAGDSITIIGTVNTAGTATDPGEYVVVAQIERRLGL